MTTLAWPRRQCATGAAAPEHDVTNICFYLAFASVTSILFSIALSQFLLALTLAVLLIRRTRLRFPPIGLPVLAFVLLTVASLLLSGDPIRGLPQIRKFFVFGTAFIVFSTFRTSRQVKALILAWSVIAALSSIRGLFQFAHRYHEAVIEKAQNYGFFLDDRIKGFSSHWMTFGAEEMIVFLMLLSLLLFSLKPRLTPYLAICLPLLWTCSVLGLTRSIFLLAIPLGSLYLIYQWKRWALAAAPVLVLLIWLCSPLQVRERIVSVVIPHTELDSNNRREIMLRTGWRMVKAHPWFGIGPEQVGPQFLRYTPPGVPRPLPKGWYGHLHNVYLQYAAERGIPATVVVIWLLVRIFFDMIQASRSARYPREAQFVFHGAVAVTLAIMAEGFFEHNLGDSEVLTMFLTVVSAAYAVRESLVRQEQNGQRATLPLQAIYTSVTTAAASRN